MGFGEDRTCVQVGLVHRRRLSVLPGTADPGAAPPDPTVAEREVRVFDAAVNGWKAEAK
jgi:hypothetical protein